MTHHTQPHTATSTGNHSNRWRSAAASFTLALAMLLFGACDALTSSTTVGGAGDATTTTASATEPVSADGTTSETAVAAAATGDEATSASPVAPAADGQIPDRFCTDTDLIGGTLSHAEVATALPLLYGQPGNPEVVLQGIAADPVTEADRRAAWLAWGLDCDYNFNDGPSVQFNNQSSGDYVEDIVTVAGMELHISEAFDSQGFELLIPRANSLTGYASIRWWIWDDEVAFADDAERRQLGIDFAALIAERMTFVEPPTPDIGQPDWYVCDQQSFVTANLPLAALGDRFDVGDWGVWNRFEPDYLRGELRCTMDFGSATQIAYHAEGTHRVTTQLIVDPNHVSSLWAWAAEAARPVDLGSGVVGHEHPDWAGAVLLPVDDHLLTVSAQWIWADGVAEPADPLAASVEVARLVVGAIG